MYFKINKTGCQTNKGVVEVRYDCYLSRTDPGNEEHYVTVPDYENNPPYDGKLDDMGAPVDLDDYQKWHDSLPTITRNNPFCCHFRQFPETVTDEEILQHGEDILDMAYDNHQRKDLASNWNPEIQRSTGDIYNITRSFNDELKAIAEAGKTLDLGETTKEDALYMYVAASVVPAEMGPKVAEVAVEVLAKIDACDNRVSAILDTDFTTLAKAESRIRA